MELQNGENLEEMLFCIETEGSKTIKAILNTEGSIFNLQKGKKRGEKTFNDSAFVVLSNFVQALVTFFEIAIAIGEMDGEVRGCKERRTNLFGKGRTGMVCNVQLSFVLTFRAHSEGIGK